MKKYTLRTAGIAAVVVGSVLGAAAVAGFKPDQALPQCKLTPVDAMKVALRKVPGKPLSATFEFDEGHWVYGVMIVHNHKISEVELDPISGKLGDVEDVDPAGEAKEMKDDLTKALK